MKIVEIVLDKFRPMFGEGGKFHRLHPIYDAADNALLSPTFKTDNAPFGRDATDVKRYMFMVILALMPCLAASIYFFGWRILAMLMVSYVAGGIVEVLFAIVRKEEINEGFLVTGFIFPLILPPNLPLWLVAVGIIFGVLVGKEVFGGTGRNLFNAALVGRCFLAFGYTPLMAKAWVQPATGAWGGLFSYSTANADAVTSATPLVLAKAGEAVSALDLFIGRVAGSAGETSALAVILGGVFLVSTGIANWRTVVGILASFAALSAVLHSTAPDVAGPAWLNLLSGGILFGAFFMATDPVTSPLTLPAKWTYGILIGATTVLIRTFSGYVEGVTFAILLGNICAPLMDEVTIRLRVRRYAREG